MLLSNVSDTLCNRATGVFVGAEEHLVVEFDNVGSVAIKRETWEKWSRSGSVVASRRQFPLSLVYGMTCHKSQSLTLPAAVVHGSKEFTPGFVYVALSRVKTSQHLQVLNFSPDQLLQPSQDCLDVCVSNQNMGDSTGNCCAQIALAPSEFTVDEASDETVTETDEENSEIADITDKVVKAYFNRKENDDVAISDIQTDMETNMADDLDLETISMLLMSEEGHLLSSPPMWFKIKEILQDMKVPSSVVESSQRRLDNYSQSIMGSELLITRAFSLTR